MRPRTGTDGFLHHMRLGLVGWISYWCLGDSGLAVDILVALINTLGLTELVSDALGKRKQKEAETNVKIVDLLKHLVACANMRSGHFWICKFGTVPGSMSCVEKKFKLQTRKWEEYKGTTQGTTTGTKTSSLNCGCIGLLMICQDSRFRSGTPQRVLTMQVLRWQWSSTRASCAPRTSTSRK